jgi:hypothetical protein
MYIPISDYHAPQQIYEQFGTIQRNLLLVEKLSHIILQPVGETQARQLQDGLSDTRKEQTMQLFGDPQKQPLDQEDLLARIREMERLAGQIEPMLDQPHKDPNFKFRVLRYQLVGAEVRRLLMRAEEVLDDADLAALKHRLNTCIQPGALNRFEKYRQTNYETEQGI